MIIEKIFSEQNSNEKLYSVLMNEDEISLFSDFQERIYTGGTMVKAVLNNVANGGNAGSVYGRMRSRLAQNLAAQRANINSLGLNNEARNKAYESVLTDSKRAKNKIDKTLMEKFDLEAAEPNAAYMTTKPQEMWTNPDGSPNRMSFALLRSKSRKLPNTNRMLLPKRLDYKLNDKGVQLDNQILKYKTNN